MEKVIGIGGFFYRAKDRAALRQWYLDHLGLPGSPTDYETMPWRQSGGICVVEPFGMDADMFGPAEKQWMINFRVRDLDAMVAQLRAAGIDVEVDPEAYPNGRFAQLDDPEGNPIQLWEPAGVAREVEEG